MDRENQGMQSPPRENPPSEIPPTDNLPAVIDDDDGDLIVRWESNARTFATNMDTTTPSGRALLTRCKAKVTKKTRNAVGEPFKVVGWMVHEAKILNVATGEYEKRLRAVLICETGELVSTMSGPVLSTLKDIAVARGPGRWDPPSILQIREWPIEGGKSYCDMIELDPEEVEPKKAKK